MTEYHTQLVDYYSVVTLVAVEGAGIGLLPFALHVITKNDDNVWSNVDKAKARVCSTWCFYGIKKTIS